MAHLVKLPESRAKSELEINGSKNLFKVLRHQQAVEIQ